MIVVNTESVPGYAIAEVKGMVQGSTVRAKNVGRDIAASFKNMVGGEARNMTRLYQRARREATLRMLAHAQAAGFNAVCNLRYDSADIGGNAVMPQKKNRVIACCAVTATAYSRLA